MAKNKLQIVELINLLVEQTRSGVLVWDTNVLGGYQARLGNYVIQITGARQGMLGAADTRLKVRRLDGSVVEEVSTGIRGLLQQNELDDATKEQLNKLFEMLSDSNAELSELIRLLRS